MAMSEQWYLEGRLEAQYHVQVALPAPLVIAAAPADLDILAKVVRVFRAEDELKEGAEVHLELRVVPRGHVVAGLRPLFADDFAGAHCLELYFDRRPWYSRDRVVRGQIVRIDAPTDEPVLKTPAKAEIAALNPHAGITHLDIVFVEPDFPSDWDEEGPRAALDRIGVELGKPDPDLNQIREWLSVEGVGYNKRFMASTIIHRYQQAEVGKPSPEDVRILGELLEGLRQKVAISRLREIARQLPASRLASSDPQERAAGERLRERIERI